MTRPPAVLARLRAGARIALVSDAGTPLVSDPGYRLVRAAIASRPAGAAVPGPNAAVMALTLSGLPPHPFLFLGFLPVKAGPRTAEIARLRAVERAGLPPRDFLRGAAPAGGHPGGAGRGLRPDRPAAVARELTKRFEEVRRGTLALLAAHYAAEPARGEIAIVIGPAPEEATGEAETGDHALRDALAAGLSVRDAAAAVAAATGLPRKQVYRRALEMGGGNGGDEG